jgi:hypothetical protein
MKLFLSLFFVALSSLSPAPTAPNLDAEEKTIQGTWRLAGTNGRHSWFLEWTFDAGKFKLQGYPPLYQEGSYRIVKTDGNKLTLELYDQKGNFGTEPSQIEILVNKAGDRLKIKGQEPFTRVKASRNADK